MKKVILGFLFVLVLTIPFGTSLAFTPGPIPGQPDIFVWPDYLNFGTVKMGQHSVVKYLHVFNNSPTSNFDGLVIYSMRIKGAGISGDHDPDIYQFFQQNNCNFVLYAGESCNIAVLFQPTSAGTKNVYLEIVSNDRDEPVSLHPLFGKGVR